jgi:hypothetical protein
MSELVIFFLNLYNVVLIEWGGGGVALVTGVLIVNRMEGALSCLGKIEIMDNRFNLGLK